MLKTAFLMCMYAILTQRQYTVIPDQLPFRNSKIEPPLAHCRANIRTIAF